MFKYCTKTDDLRWMWNFLGFFTFSFHHSIYWTKGLFTRNFLKKNGPLLFSIMSMVTGSITDRMGDETILSIIHWHNAKQ